jgi:hypothetical protein
MDGINARTFPLPAAKINKKINESLFNPVIVNVIVLAPRDQIKPISGGLQKSDGETGRSFQGKSFV